MRFDAQHGIYIQIPFSISVAKQLFITFAMLHSVTNHTVRCILLVNGNTCLVNITLTIF